MSCVMPDISQGSRGRTGYPASPRFLFPEQSRSIRILKPQGTWKRELRSKELPQWLTGHSRKRKVVEPEPQFIPGQDLLQEGK
ncbi:hypothetical protein NCU16993 [Neurospora crassa OR74A]|uniref:Uncharacterized protein n=1 Tax=Neurospora crassa (strain ATCC 24698 / 74-OR23-1A / CBS 708.71 / DSM 1257 / FGSC 987) TaxID=367110 RepID=V5IMB8_NEUCR|nr:hypothetical protein NCU16993 [Neurospora crassa OR74A]ESA42530.1 hypothetical protein NCU16993 [Neurospora crassa OR74A]|eukprot:XP_011394833.1 hypothetical protein NCU16993 [Neurospora crassa OR74A]